MPYKATVEFDSIVLRDHRLQVFNNQKDDDATNLNKLEIVCSDILKGLLKTLIPNTLARK